MTKEIQITSHLTWRSEATNPSAATGCNAAALLTRGRCTTRELELFDVEEAALDSDNPSWIFSKLEDGRTSSKSSFKGNTRGCQGARGCQRTETTNGSCICKVGCFSQQVYVNISVMFSSLPRSKNVWMWAWVVACDRLANCPGCNTIRIKSYTSWMDIHNNKQQQQQYITK